MAIKSKARHDLSIAWDGEVDSITVGQTLTGRITWLPDGANTETALLVRTTGDAVAVRYANGIFTAQGKAAGTSTMTVTMLNRVEKTVTFTVKEA